MLHTAAILLIENTVNKIIASDTVTANALQALEGKVFEFIISDAPVHFFILPVVGGFEIQQTFAAQSDTQMRGSLTNFKQLLLSQNKSAQFFGNGLEISGDTQLAAKLQRIINNAQIDWQGLLANLTGDLIAHQLASVTSAATKQFTLTKNSLELNLSDYLQEEIRYLPARAEVEGFIEDIDDISQETDRLEARIRLLTIN
jgi:ubiquinone biosynthesis protein UbiJ